jgi:hypothetical protein
VLALKLKTYKKFKKEQNHVNTEIRK